MRDPVVDLREIARLLDRHGGQTRRAQAFRRAAATLAALDPAERADVDRRRAWGNLPGIGATTTKVVAESHAGRVPAGTPTAASSQTNGTYEILVPGPGRYVLTVADAQRTSDRPFLIADLSDRATAADGLDFTVRQAAQGPRIDGFVVALDSSGRFPVSGFARLRVDLLDQGTRTQVHSTVTDAQGRYFFEGLAPGGYLVSAGGGESLREVACHIFADGGRLVAPPLSLPVPRPWWPPPGWGWRCWPTAPATDSWA